MPQDGRDFFHLMWRATKEIQREAGSEAWYLCPCPQVRTKRGPTLLALRVMTAKFAGLHELQSGLLKGLYRGNYRAVLWGGCKRGSRGLHYSTRHRRKNRMCNPGRASCPTCQWALDEPSDRIRISDPSGDFSCQATHEAAQSHSRTC